MWGDEETFPMGFRPVLSVPTGHEMRRLWPKTTWTCVPESVLKKLRIPEHQKEFLFWPGLPNYLTDGKAQNFLKNKTEIVYKHEQFLFNDFYVVSDEIIMEFGTGNIYKKCFSEYKEFFSVGISEFIIFDFIEDNYSGCKGYIRQGFYEDNESPLGGTCGVIAPFFVFPNEVTELLSLIDHERLVSDSLSDEHGLHRSDYDDYGWIFPDTE